jgi:hypothetical protein
VGQLDDGRIAAGPLTALYQTQQHLRSHPFGQFLTIVAARHWKLFPPTSTNISVNGWTCWREAGVRHHYTDVPK